MCDFSGKDSKLHKDMAKKYEGFGPIGIPANPRANSPIQ